VRKWEKRAAEEECKCRRRSREEAWKKRTEEEYRGRRGLSREGRKISKKRSEDAEK